MYEQSSFEPIRILGVIEEEVGRPRNDGTAGSALYEVPLRLSAKAPSEWATLFERVWDNPPQYSSMHRRGARVVGDRIILTRTTLDELERYHAATLKLVLDTVNASYIQHLEDASRQNERALRSEEEHRKNVSDAARRIKFD